MGQTQILFIVLSVIIVGIAVAVGITQFGSNTVTANRNAVLLDLQDIGGKAQTWYRTPAGMGGGNNSYAGLDFDDMGLTRGSGGTTTYTNNNGTYTLNGTPGATVTFDAVGSEAVNHYRVTAYPESLGTPIKQ